jgi:hypothetical protein
MTSDGQGREFLAVVRTPMELGYMRDVADDCGLDGSTAALPLQFAPSAFR